MSESFAALVALSGVPGFRELDGLNIRELRVELAEARRFRSMLDGRVVDIVRRIEDSTREVGTHERSIPEVELVAHGGMTRREAGDVLRRALVIEDAPVVGDALAAGDLSAGHVDAISRGLKIAGDSRDAFLELVPGLVEAASEMSVPEFAAEVSRAAKGVVTDGGLSVFEDQRRSTYLKIWNDANGMVNVRGAFDPEIGSILQSRVNTQVETMFHSGDRDVPVTHHPWVEPNDFRRAHALVALVADDHEDCSRPGGRGSAGHDGMSTDRSSSRTAISRTAMLRTAISRTAISRTGGSCRSDVVVHVDLETLTNGLSESSTHRTAFGADLPVETIRRIACDANIIPLVLNGKGMPLDIGRSQRLASAAQRRALEATHDTCAFDRCAVAFHACQIHHIDYWETGGPTDLANMVPLCSKHHH
ncbi:MAG: DUF222 domain-containing protein, partial [Actinomycetota bacterium]